MKNCYSYSLAMVQKPLSTQKQGKNGFPISPQSKTAYYQKLFYYWKQWQTLSCIDMTLKRKEMNEVIEFEDDFIDMYQLHTKKKQK